MSAIFEPATHAAEILRQRIAILQEGLRREMSGKMVLTPRAKTIMQRISEAENELEEALHPTKAPLSQLLKDDPEARRRIYRRLFKVPVAADLLYSTLVDLQSAVRKLGVTEVTISETIATARKAIERVVFLVDTDSTGKLSQMLEEDSKLIEHQDILLDRFLDEHFDKLF